MLTNPDDANLTKGSMKQVSLICDYCGDKFTRRWDQRVVSNKYVNKDSCKKCSIKKREETTLVKYGVRVASQSVEVRKKASKTKGGSGKCVADYHDKILEMYHGDMSVNEIAKILELGRTALRTYMEEIGLDTKGDMQAKAKRTCKERYGKEYFLQSDIGQEKLKETFKKKYGSENPFRNPEFSKMVHEKQKETILERYGVTDILNCEERREEHEKKRAETRKKNGQLIYDGKTVIEWAKEKGMSIAGMYQKVQKLGLEDAIKSDKNTTKLEGRMIQLLKEIDVPFRTQVGIERRIADFVIDDYNLVIEVDGLYWHCDAIIKECSHHARKRKTYIDNGYFPLFFREDEVYNKPHIIKSIIMNKLGRSQRIYARDCKLKQKEKGDGHDFVNQNHLMGRGKHINFTLEKDGEILSCLTIRRAKGNIYEVSRFCHKCGYSVIGGFSRLINFAQTKLNMDELFTFIDLRYGSGKYLEGLGFKYVGEHISFKWTDTIQTLHRMRFPNNSGYKNGFFKIYDCGQAKYTIRYIKNGV